MQAATAEKAAKKPTARSRVSNGNSLGEMDGRSKWARRLRDLIELYSADIAASDELTNMQRSLVRRAATMTVELERAEDEFAEAGKADEKSLAAYQTTCNTLRRTLETLGLSSAKLKDASDLRRELDGRRLCDDAVQQMRDVHGDAVIDGLLGTDGKWAVAGMPGQNKRGDKGGYEIARRLAFAIADAVDKGRPLSPAITEFAEEAGIIKRVDPQPEPDAT